MVKLEKRCPIDLDSQPRSEVGFNCNHCAQPVFDTSLWTESQFDRFLERHRGKTLPCMRVMSDVDGVLLFKAEERMSGIKKRLLPLAVVSGLAACTSQEGQLEESVELRPLPHSTEPSGEPTSQTRETRAAELAPPVERIGAPVSSPEVVNQSNITRTESQRPMQRRRSTRHRMVSQNGAQSGPSGPSSGPPSGPPVMYDGMMVDDTVLGVINHPNSNNGR